MSEMSSRYLGEEGAREVVPEAPGGEPVTFYAAKNRAYVKRPPFVGPAGQVDVAALRSRIEFVRDYVNGIVLGKIRIEGNFVDGEPFRWLGNRALRPVNDEAFAFVGT